MKNILFIGLGGMMGALLRYAIGLLSLEEQVLKIGAGTLLSNLLGCLIFGLIYTWSSKTDLFSLEVRNLLLIGFCGGLTTFSSFIFDLIRYFEIGDYLKGMGYLSLNLGLGILAFFLGTILVNAFQAN